MRIKFPKQFSRGCVDRIDLGKRCAHVGDAVDLDRLGNHAHLSLDVQVPSETQLIDVLVIDLLQRAEMRGIVIAAVDHPVGPDRCVGANARVGHFRPFFVNVGKGTGLHHCGERKECQTEQDHVLGLHRKIAFLAKYVSSL